MKTDLVLANQAAKMAVELKNVCKFENSLHVLTINIHSYELQIQSFDERGEIDSFDSSPRKDDLTNSKPAPDVIDIKIEKSEKVLKGKIPLEKRGTAENIDLDHELLGEKRSQHNLSQKKKILSSTKSMRVDNFDFLKATPRKGPGGILGRKIAEAKSKVQSRRQSTCFFTKNILADDNRSANSSQNAPFELNKSRSVMIHEPDKRARIRKTPNKSIMGSNDDSDDEKLNNDFSRSITINDELFARMRNLQNKLKTKVAMIQQQDDDYTKEVKQIMKKIRDDQAYLRSMMNGLVTK